MSKFLTGARPVSLGRFHAFASLLIAFALALITAHEAHAAAMARIIEAHPKNTGPARTCEDAFRLNQYQIVDTVYKSFGNGQGDTGQTRTFAFDRSPEIDPIVIRVLSDWVTTHDYTLSQAEMLFNRDRSLDPRRTMYIHLETDGHPAMVRIFDASTTVLSGGSVWQTASETSSRAPIEIGNPGYEIPEHAWAKADPNRPAYISEISLLNIDRQLKSGVEAVLGHIAERLDRHYNDQEYRVLGSTQLLEKRKMMIYAQTRANRVNLFKKYGFEPVYEIDSNGVIKPHELSPNSVLMTIPAATFVRLHQKTTVFAGAKKSKNREEDIQYAGDEDKRRAHFHALEGRRVQVRNMDDVMAHMQNLMRTWVTVRMMTGKTPERRDVAIDFFENFYVFVNSIPDSLRDPNWVNARNMLREAISRNDPFTALYYFSLSTDRLGTTENYDDTRERYERFFNEPLQSEIKLFAPTIPMPVLKFKPGVY